MVILFVYYINLAKIHIPYTGIGYDEMVELVPRNTAAVLTALEGCCSFNGFSLRGGCEQNLKDVSSIQRHGSASQSILWLENFIDGLEVHSI